MVVRSGLLVRVTCQCLVVFQITQHIRFHCWHTNGDDTNVNVRGQRILPFISGETQLADTCSRYDYGLAISFSVRFQVFGGERTA